MSHRLLAVVEGQTEFSVLNSTVAPHLGIYGVFLYPKVIGKPGHKGGIRSFNAVAEEIINLFKQEPTAIVTTFFDFYALPDDWPGLAIAKQAKSNGLAISQVAGLVEEAMQTVVAAQAATLPHAARFIPYVQMHELETLMFAGPKEMAEGFLKPELELVLAGIVSECGGCEEINDRPLLAPSKRIEKLFPSYRKGRDRNKREDRRPHAPSITARIGIPTIRTACPHFDEWLRRLEAISASVREY